MSNALFQLVHRSTKKDGTHQEAREICLLKPQESITSSTYTFTISRHGDLVSHLMLHFDKIPYSNLRLPDHFPFLFIKTLVFQVGATCVLKLSGLQLWGFICSLPPQKQTELKTAAKRGIISLNELIPTLYIVSCPFSLLQLIVEIDNENVKALSKHHTSMVSSIISTACDIPVELSRMSIMYTNPIDISSITLLQPFIFASTGIRNELCEQTQPVTCTMCEFIERNGSGGVQFLNSKIALQFNVLVENSKNPGTFFTSHECPVEEIEIKFSNVTVQKGGPDMFLIADKLLHDIPLPQTNIAHYTWTFQTFDKFKLGQGFIPKSSVQMHHRSHDYQVFVKLSPHIDPNARILVWVQYVNTYMYAQGACGVY